MDCYILGLLSLSLIGGSIATLSVSEEQHNILRNVFSDELDIKYENIITERRNHYILGLLFGMFITSMIIKRLSIPNTFTYISFFFSMTLGIAIIIYMLMPKSDYMLNYLKTNEENKKWLEIYKTMKSRYYIGFVLGALASIPLSNIFCK